MVRRRFSPPESVRARLFATWSMPNFSSSCWHCWSRSYFGVVLRFHDREDVLADGELAEDGLLLRQVAHAEARALIHRLVGGVVAVEEDLAAVRPHEADDHVERGGLARAVGAEQPDDLALADLDVDAVHHRATVIDFLQPAGEEQNVIAAGVDRHGGAVLERAVAKVGVRDGTDLHAAVRGPVLRRQLGGGIAAFLHFLAGFLGCQRAGAPGTAPGELGAGRLGFAARSGFCSILVSAGPWTFSSPFCFRTM